MSALLPVTLPPQQLPQTTDRLSAAFVREFGRPAGLWMPSKLALAAADLSGNRNFGVFTGAITTPCDGVGVLGQSWKLGSSKDIDCGSAIQTGAVFSVAAVVKSIAVSVSAIICCKQYNGSSAVPFTLNLLPSSSGFFGSNYGGFAYYANGSWSKSGVSTDIRGDGKWHFICGVFDGSRLLYYLDGNLDSSAAIAGNHLDAPTAFRIGSYVNDGLWFDGQIAFVSSFPIAFSASQVSALYSSLLYGEPYRLFASSVMERMYSIRKSGFPYPLLMSGVN